MSHVFRRKKLLLICLIASMVFSLAKVSVPVSSSPSPGTKVYVEMPPEGYINGTEIGVNNTFTVDVCIENATDLVQWSLCVQVDPNVLNISSVEDPRADGTVIHDYVEWCQDNWINVGEYYTFDSVIPEEGKIINASHGISSWPNLYTESGLLDEPPGGFNGSGKLCNLTFTVLDETAYSPIHLFDILLFDGQNYTTGDPHYFPPDIVEDGHFNEPPAGGDAAVTNVVPAQNQVYPTWIVPLNISVTVLNNGTEPINCTVAVYYNDTLIGTPQLVESLNPSQAMDLRFCWTLTGVDWGNYTIKANATLLDVPDTNLANNELVDDTVLVKMPGDVNGDGEVKGLDLTYFADAWWSEIGEGNYNQQCDFDNNGDVKGLDLTYFANYWWQTTDKY